MRGAAFFVHAGGVARPTAIQRLTGAVVLVNEFAPANAMVGIADKSAPTRRNNLRPYRHGKSVLNFNLLIQRNYFSSFSSNLRQHAAS